MFFTVSNEEASLLDPPRGRPVGGGGTTRSFEGMGASAPIIMSGLATLFRKSSGHEPRISKKSDSIAECFQKSPVRLTDFSKNV
jgi:hypothetical protein